MAPSSKIIIKYCNFTVLIFILGFVSSTIAISLPPQLTDKIHTDPDAIKSASTDYGRIISRKPEAVLYPSSVEDIKNLINFSYSSSVPYTVAAKGRAHSVKGQAQANNGVVVEMSSLNNFRNESSRIVISGSRSSGFYADVGGEELWINVLYTTLKRGLSPVSWTDYLYLSVGGTLSNAGICGQTHRRGPQISNVLELDVLTGKGELLSCSRRQNSELFYGVLGGLGQFGIITRARIVIEPAKRRARWARILYSDFAAFSTDQEKLISATGPKQKMQDYLEGQLLMNSNDLDFYPTSHRQKITSLLKQYGIIYVLEVAKYYDNHNHIRANKNAVDKEMEKLFKNLKGFIPGFIFEVDVSYLDFLNRVHAEELALRKKGLWDIYHPWLNLFIPKSRMLDFNNGVFRDILLKRNFTSSLVLVYPMLSNKWDDRMSAVIPDEDVFYNAAFLDAAVDNFQALDDKNKEILQFCNNASIQAKEYLPHYATKEEWMKHFGPKWNTFQQRKILFDPKMILSPGQRIFNNS